MNCDNHLMVTPVVLSVARKHEIAVKEDKVLQQLEELGKLLIFS